MWCVCVCVCVLLTLFQTGDGIFDSADSEGDSWLDFFFSVTHLIIPILLRTPCLAPPPCDRVDMLTEVTFDSCDSDFDTVLSVWRLDTIFDSPTPIV